MRFGIKDMFAATFVVALILLAVRSNQQVQQRSFQVAEIKQQLRLTRDQINREKASLVNVDAKLDFSEEISSIHDAALNAFAEVELKLGIIEPQPGRISYRRLPTLKEDRSQSKWAFRISIPREYPVFLRSGVGPIDAVSSQGRSILDDQDWLKDTPLDDSSGRQAQLAPGIHEVLLITRRGNFDSDPASIFIKLDGEVIFQSKQFLLNHKFGSSISSSPRKQYDLRFDAPSNRKGRLTEFLVGIEIERTDEQAAPQSMDFEFWIWLSATPMPNKFTEYSARGAVDE